MKPLNKTSVRQVFLALVLAGMIIEFKRSTLGTLGVVDGPSMYPTFNSDDVVQADPEFSETHRGDVAIITDGDGQRAIKRLIGLPGETVTIYRGFVYINGQRLSEPYLGKHTYTFNSNQRDQRAFVWHLDADQYFVLGDNRDESHDSRYYGPLRKNQLHGMVYLPANAPGPAFCDFMLSESGKVMRKFSHPGSDQSRIPNDS